MRWIFISIVAFFLLSSRALPHPVHAALPPPPICARSATEINLSELPPTNGLNHPFTVYNHDSESCPISTISLSAVVTNVAFWGIQMNPSSMNLAPGKQASGTLTLIPPPNTPDGAYTIMVNAKALNTSSGSVWTTKYTYLVYIQSNTPTPTVRATPYPTAVQIACSPADLDHDGAVNIVDYKLLLANFFKTNPANFRADINRDGLVDISDYAILAKEYGRSTGWPCL